jgi:hypothetical protein
LKLLRSNLTASVFLLADDSIMVPRRGTKVALQHPFWGDVSP